jgi:membrane associated rhomboid family serine protease
MHDAAVGHQCPQCVAEGRRTQRTARTAFGGTLRGQRGTVTLTLIGINVAVFLIGLATAQRGAQAALGGQGFGGLFGGSTPLHDWGGVLGLAPYDKGGELHGVAAGEYYRLFTAMFLHFGALHLIMNMYALWVLGRNLEAALGPARFLALYLVSGIGGNVAAYVFSAPNQLTAGASTALFGLLGAYVFVLRKLGLSLSGLVPAIVINLIITFTLARYISVAGHLGGLVTGAAVGAGLAYAPRSARTQVQAATVAGIVLLLGMATIARTNLLLG